MRKGLILLIVVGLLAGIVASYRNKVLADNEQRFKARYGDD